MAIARDVQGQDTNLDTQIKKINVERNMIEKNYNDLLAKYTSLKFDYDNLVSKLEVKQELSKEQILKSRRHLDAISVEKAKLREINKNDDAIKSAIDKMSVDKAHNKIEKE